MANKFADYIPQPAGQGQPQYAPRLGLRGWLENLSARVGQGQVNALAGLLDTVKHPVQTGRGLLAAAANPGQTVNALAGYYGDKIGEGPLGIAELVGENLSPRSLLGVNPAMKAMGPGMMQEITTYHGSPHRINNVSPDAPMGKFDLSKVGTGEGAQAYGHGIYLAEAPGTARTYQAMAPHKIVVNGESITGKMGLEGRHDAVTKAWNEVTAAYDGKHQNPFKTAKERLSGKYGPRNATDADALKIIEDWQSKGATVEQGGHFYTVDLPDEHVAKMLDWDKPLSEQPANVKAAAQKLLAREIENAKLPAGPEWGDLSAPYDPMQMTGGDLLGRLTQQFGRDSENPMQGSRAASEALRQAGIPGIRYLDEGSHNPSLAPYWKLVRESDDTTVRQLIAKPESVPNGFRLEGPIDKRTRNFVIFDTDVAKILKRE